MTGFGAPTGSLRLFASRRRPSGLGDRIAAGVILAIAVAAFAVSVSYGLLVDGRPQPGLYPAVVSGLLAILSLIWLIVGAGRPPHVSAMTELAESLMSESDLDPHLAEDAEDEPAMSRRGRRVVLFATLWALVPILLLQPLGFVITMTVYMTGMLIVVARVRWWLALPITAVATVLTGLGASAAGIALPDPLRLMSLIGG